MPVIIFLPLSSWQRYCDCSHGEFDECRLSARWPPTLKPSQYWLTLRIGRYYPHPPSPFNLLLLLCLPALKADTHFTVLRRLKDESTYRQCCKQWQKWYLRGGEAVVYMANAEREPIAEVWGQSPSGVQGQSPQLGVRGWWPLYPCLRPVYTAVFPYTTVYMSREHGTHYPADTAVYTDTVVYTTVYTGHKQGTCTLVHHFVARWSCISICSKLRRFPYLYFRCKSLTSRLDFVTNGYLVCENVIGISYLALVKPQNRTYEIALKPGVKE